jgi:hypothetical protein
MAEHFLNRSKIGAMLQQMRRERMAQYMRFHGLLNMSGGGISLYQFPKGLPRNPAAHAADEQRRNFPAFGKYGPGGRYILLKARYRFFPQRHNALLIALSDTTHEADF